MSNNIRDKVIVIAGASSGLGEAAARHLLNMKSISLSIFSAVLFSVVGIANMNAQTSPNQQTALSPRQQSIVVISALTAKGNLQHLQPALATGLDAGLTINESKEVLVHLYAYCGFPRSIRGLQTLMTVLDERKKKGITDKVGKEATPITSQESKYERGKNVLATLSGQSPTGPPRGYSAFSPEIEVF